MLQNNGSGSKVQEESFVNVSEGVSLGEGNQVLNASAAHLNYDK